MTVIVTESFTKKYMVKATKKVFRNSKCNMIHIKFSENNKPEIIK